MASPQRELARGSGGQSTWLPFPGRFPLPSPTGLADEGSPDPPDLDPARPAPGSVREGTRRGIRPDRRSHVVDREIPRKSCSTATTCDIAEPRARVHRTLVLSAREHRATRHQLGSSRRVAAALRGVLLRYATRLDLGPARPRRASCLCPFDSMPTCEARRRRERNSHANWYDPSSRVSLRRARPSVRMAGASIGSGRRWPCRGTSGPRWTPPMISTLIDPLTKHVEIVFRERSHGIEHVRPRSSGRRTPSGRIDRNRSSEDGVPGRGDRLARWRVLPGSL